MTRTGGARKTRLARHRFKWSLVAVVLVAALSALLWNIHKSRSYQFFGDIVSRVETTEKAIALTFDDGPNPEHIDALIALLDELDVRATFFVVGQDLDANIAAGTKLVANGHELGNHSYTHTRMVLRSPSFVESELVRTDLAIRRAGYTGPIYFRAPFCKKLFTLPLYLSRTGRTSVTFDIEPDSYPDIAGDPTRIAEYVVSHARPGSVVLLHVMYGNYENAFQAITPIVRELRQQGYRFVTVSDLLTLRKE